MDSLTKVGPGDPLRIKAGTWNAFVDAARGFRDRQQDARSGLRTRDTKSGMVWIRNDTGLDLDQFAVVGFDLPAIGPAENETEFRNNPVLSGVVPDKALHRGRFAVLAEPAKAGTIARAYVDDVVPVRLNVPDGEEDCHFAEIEDGNTDRLKTAGYGSATILWREGGTSEQWAVVRIAHAPTVFLAKLTQVGGTQGNDQNPASWTYDVSDPCTFEDLAPAVDPTMAPHLWKRPSLGPVIQATYGLGRFDENGDLALLWINEVPDRSAASLFPVNLVQFGGSQGTATAAATWTYDVKDVATGATIASAVNPTASPHKWKRPSVGYMIPATFGYARYSSPGVISLGWINEVPDQEACPS